MPLTPRPASRSALIVIALVPLAAIGLANLTPAQEAPPGPLLTETTPPAASAWDYKALPRKEVVRLAPGHRGDYIRPEDLLDDFNAGLGVLGDAGWQLVAVEPYHKEGYVSWPAIYVFRRPK